MTSENLEMSIHTANEPQMESPLALQSHQFRADDMYTLYRAQIIPEMRIRPAAPDSVRFVEKLIPPDGSMYTKVIYILPSV